MDEKVTNVPLRPSIRQTLRSEIRRVIGRVAGGTFVGGLILGFVAGFYHFDSRARLVAEGLQHNLTQLVSVGDYFQLNRQIGSLVDSAHFSGIWVYDGIHGSVVARASELSPEFIPVPGELQRRLAWQDKGIVLVRTFALKDRSAVRIGTVVFAVKAPLMQLFLFALGLASAMSLLCWLLIRKLKNVSHTITDPMVEFSDFLVDLQPGTAAVEIPTLHFPFREIEDSFVVFRQLWKRLGEYQEREKQAAKEAAIGAVVSQVAHDIRSPLTALKVGLQDLSSVSEERRALLRSALNRISEIADDLLKRRRETVITPEQKGVRGLPPSSSSLSVEMLSNLVESVCSEKQLQFQCRSQLRISAELGPVSYGLFALVATAGFRRILSNLINNAADSISGPGEISVRLEATASQISLRVRDTGKGIPSEVLPRLFQKGATFGKASGSGLGLHHAQQSTQAWGGTIGIESEVGKGTEVIIQLPRLKDPAWFASAIVVERGSEVVIVDDEPFAHFAWDQRFSVARKRGTKIAHLHSPSELEEWLAKQSPKSNRQFLVDYEFAGSDTNGLETIQALGIEAQSTLVTGRFDESALRDCCESAGVRIIPKTMVPIVPITMRGGGMETSGQEVRCAPPEHC